MSGLFVTLSFALGAAGIACGLAAFDSEVRGRRAGGVWVLRWDWVERSRERLERAPPAALRHMVSALRRYLVCAAFVLGALVARFCADLLP